MAIPTSYTESGLALYMHAALGAVADALGYTAPASYAETVNDTLTALGLTDISEATDIAALRAVAKREAWRKAKADAGALFDFKADSGDFSRSQILAGIEKNLNDAAAAAAAYAADDERYSASVTPVTYNDPYSWAEDDGA